MSALWWVSFGTINIAILAAIIAQKIMRRKKTIKAAATQAAYITTKLQNIRSVIERINANEEAARAELINNFSNWRVLVLRHGDPELSGQFSAAHIKAKLDHQYDARIPEVKRWILAWKSESDPQQKLERWARFASLLRQLDSANQRRAIAELNYDHEPTLASFQQWVDQHYEALCDQAPTSSDAFYKLRKLIQRLRDSDDNMRRAGIESVDYPEQWNQWVAQYIQNPPLGAFVDLNQPVDGAVRLMAAEAWQNGNLLLAKIVLAYCNNNAKYRVEVGDYLTAKLAILIKSPAVTQY